MEQAVLELKNVTKKYGQRLAVNDISLTVNAGEIYGFIGPNGAGKTTMIRLIVGLAGITSGEIKICGHSVKKDFENAIRNVGGIIENPELYGYLTGMQNLELFAGLYKGITKDQIYKVIALVGLQNRIHDRVKKYSLGMRQRLGIAQSLLHNPKILILDEPTNGLDPAGIREIRDLLKTLAHEKGVAVFISSHILSEMQLLCDRAAIIDKGKFVKVLELTKTNEIKIKLKQIFAIKTDNNKEAEKILNKSFNDIKAVINKKDNIINIEANEDYIPKIIETLVKENIGIYMVKPIKQNLESMFLDATKDSRIV